MTRDELRPMVAALIATSWELWGVSLANNARREWMLNPRPGDLVLIAHTMPNHEPLDRIGRLKLTEHRPNPDWEDDEPAPTHQVWLIETLDGREVNWENVQVLRVPEREGEFLDLVLTRRTG